MLIEFDSAKREQTLIDRGLDFADAPKYFPASISPWRMTEPIMANSALSLSAS